MLLLLPFDNIYTYYGITHTHSRHVLTNYHFKEKNHLDMSISFDYVLEKHTPGFD